MKKADYSKIAEFYDKGRDTPVDLWLNLIAKRVGTKKDIKFLDLGCGTGKFALPIALKLGYKVTGADNSPEMLSKAKTKKGAEKITWDIQNASSLSYQDNSYNVIFMSHLLHHVDDPVKVIKECCRVLKPGGILINRYGAIENVTNDPVHTFFPETVEIDKRRGSSINQVEQWFSEAGFKQIESITIDQKTYQSADAVFQRTKVKSTSVLTLISDSSFREGLAKYEKYITDYPNDPWLFIDKITLTSGNKS